MTAKSFWGNFFMVVGGFLVVFCGGCGAFFEIYAFTHEKTSREDYFSDPVAPLVIGGVPAFFGLMFFLLGRWMKRRAAKKDQGQKGAGI